MTGDLPFRIRVGVVGDLPGEDLERACHDVSDRLTDTVERLFNARSLLLLGPIDDRSRHLATPIGLAVMVCPRTEAEGAIAERIAARPGTRVQVVVPVACDDFLTSLTSDTARGHARRLIESSRSVVVRTVDGGQDGVAAAPRAIDRFLVDHCDLILILGSDQPPRWALTRCRERRRPFVQIAPSVSDTWSVEPGHGLDASSIRRLEAFNRFRVPAEVHRAYLANQVNDVLGAEFAAVQSDAIAHVREHIVPWYIRASLLAKRNRRLYQSAGMLVWCLFPAAVTAVAIGALQTSVAVPAFGIELLLLATMAIVVWYADLRRSHELWTECRFLTERIRSATYLALCGCEPVARHIDPFGGDPDQRDEWMNMAFDEIWNRMPPLTPCSDESCTQVARFARRRWIEPQIAFHRQRAATARHMSRRLERFGRAAFVLALVLAGAHILLMIRGHAHRSPSALAMTFLAIALPAAGAALGGFRSHRDYSRSAKRSANMVHELTRLEHQLADVDSPESLQQLLRRAEELMMAETQDWLLMQSVPVELPG